MRYSLVQTVPPTTEPVTLAEVKAQSRIDAVDAEQDTLLGNYIEAVRQQVENETGRQLITATWVYRAWGFPGCPYIELPKPPLLTISAVAYVDADGVTQTWAGSNYRADIYAQPGRLYLAYGASWPSVRIQFDAVQITYTAGYGANAANVPEPLRTAILLWVAHLYEHREAVTEKTLDVMPLAVERFVWPYRLTNLLVG
jgi:uncharacterized phiE125 gp8 family phage protein